MITTTHVDAQPTIMSYASTSPALEASLPGLDVQCEVPTTTVDSVNSVLFATRINFPEGTTSATITSSTFSVIKKISGVQITQLSNISMSGSSWNNEGGTSSPSLFVRDSSSALINLSGNFVGTAIPNAKTVFITNHAITLGNPVFPKMVQEGDKYVISRSIGVSWVVQGVSEPQSAVLTTESTVVVVFYPTSQPTITKIEKSGDNLLITVNGLTPGSHGISWKLESSIDLVDWQPATNGTLSGNTVISFPHNSNESTRFWRVCYEKSPATL
jgi:hypothetical protein